MSESTPFIPDEEFGVCWDYMRKGELLPPEYFWRDHADWLKQQGYVLRPRYQPGWVASWKHPREIVESEDAGIHMWPWIMDATRISDQARVILKRVQRDEYPREAEIGQMFSSGLLSGDDSNHCIPTYDILSVPNNDNEILIVTPFLTNATDPEFSTVGEAIEFFRQIFEGLRFMHSHHVAHCDCKFDNIMMDSTHLYREPVHPVNNLRTFDYRRRSRAFTRTERPVKYYLIDFGLSRHYKVDCRHPWVPPGFGGDKTVPEFQGRLVVNPFRVDVYCIGNIVRNLVHGQPQHGIPARRGFKFIEPLIADMVQDDPTRRPTMDEVILRFDEILSATSSWKLRSRFARKDENPIAGVFRSVSHWTTQLVHIFNGTPALPRPGPPVSTGPVRPISIVGTLKRLGEAKRQPCLTREEGNTSARVGGFRHSV
ncbi:kinase-like domain-containing protein [Infundibulicybe gibba]|nr:kinase-like domain-containing protein [Infundibulicybe gibba]